MKISVRKISEITGFSPATVSNALNNKKGVSKETAKQIQTIAKQFGYFDDMRIGSITLVIYKNHGKVVADTPFFSTMIEGISAAANTAKFTLSISNLTRTAPDYDEALSALLNNYNSAILLLATELPLEEFQKFEAAKAPVLLLDARFENTKFHSVMIENTDSVFNAVSGLIAKGHRKIGYLKGNVRIRNFQDREKGYFNALAVNGLTPNPLHVVPLSTQMDLAYQDMKAFLEKPHAVPTAYLADNDIIALGALKALREFGYRIPEDISIIGFDDIPYSRISEPPLSTIRVFNRDLGELAVKLLVDSLSMPAHPLLKVQVCTEYIERDSVRSI